MLAILTKTLCFSAPIGMILYMAWMIAVGRPDIAMTPTDIATLLTAAVLIGLTCAFGGQPRRQRR